MGDRFRMLLLTAKESALAAFDLMLREAKENSYRESKAATDIQRVFRGTRVRIVVYFNSIAVIQIQRAFRGHKSRKLSRVMRKKKSESRQLALYNYFCLLIQKAFRGYHSRKYRANHAKRKNFVKEILEKSEEVRQMMQDYSVQQALREEKECAEKENEGFIGIARKLHYLVSTKHIRGVFNPPSDLIETPTVNGVPVDSHLRGAIRDLLRTKGVTKRGLAIDIHGTKKIPLKGLKNKLSLQASAPYYAIEQQRQADELVHRLLTTDPENKYFVSGGKTAIIDSEYISINKGDPYVDPWANPLMKRGVPSDQNQLLQSAYTRKALHARAPETPFLSRSGGNKSHVLPNDLFDVIAEAQETGGVLQRHLGVTSRFGIPENADYRPPDGVIPQPPVRASSLRLTRPKVKTFNVVMKTSLQTLKQKVIDDEKAIIQKESENYGEEDGEENQIDPLDSSDEES